MGQLSHEDVKFLIDPWFPEGTIGHNQEVDKINRVLLLCNTYGYGAIHQLVGWIKTVWDNKVGLDNQEEVDRIKEFMKHRKELRNDFQENEEELSKTFEQLQKEEELNEKR